MKKTYLFVLYIGLLGFIFLGLPDSVIYAQENFILEWLPGLLIIAQAFLLYKIVAAFTVNTKLRIGVAAISIVIVGPAFGIYLGKKQDDDLSKTGVTTQGIVYRKWETFRFQQHDEWLIRCYFIANGKRYSTFSEEDKNNVYKVGDTLKIFYLPSFPGN